MIIYADVIQLHARRMSPDESGLPAEKKPEKDGDPAPDTGTDAFREIEERNRKNAERVARDRAAANKNVLRSYRIRS